jgi:hypothetical protein
MGLSGSCRRPAYPSRRKEKRGMLHLTNDVHERRDTDELS